jgi:hypothetical protein
MTLTEIEHRAVVLKTCLKMDLVQISQAMSKTTDEINDIIIGILKKLRADSTPEWMICSMLAITPDEIQSYLALPTLVDSILPPTPREIALESKVAYLEYKIACIEEHLKMSNIYIPDRF